MTGRHGSVSLTNQIKDITYQCIALAGVCACGSSWGWALQPGAPAVEGLPWKAGRHTTADKQVCVCLLFDTRTQSMHIEPGALSHKQAKGVVELLRHCTLPCCVVCSSNTTGVPGPWMLQGRLS